MLSAKRSAPGRRTSVYARAYGVRFGVDVDDASVLPAVVARLPPGTRACQSSARSFECSVVKAAAPLDAGQTERWQVHVGTESEAHTHSEGEALEAFEGLLRFEVARRATLWTFIHAGVVGWRGRAIVIPGFSFAGKSTLVEALVRAGATYYSDEFAVCDHRGLVYPFAQPLTIRESGGRNRRVTAGELGITSDSPPLPIGTIVSTQYVPGAVWRPLCGSPAEGVLALLPHTLRAQQAPARVMRLLARVAETAVTLTGLRGEAEDTAADLLIRATAGIPTEETA
jgi:hypothetical protein